MTFDKIKEDVRNLPEEELAKLISYAHHLRRLRDPEVLKKLRRRKSERGATHLLTPEEFEARLGDV